jgi:hypothetical protein
MFDPRPNIHVAVLCAVLAGTAASAARADGAGTAPAVAIDLPGGGQNGYT